MSKDFNRMQELETELGVEICSYGLAPNPWGYCYEILDSGLFETTESTLIRELELLCNNAKEGYL